MAALRAAGILLRHSHASSHLPLHPPSLAIRSSSLHSDALPPIKIAAIAGSIRKASTNQGLIRAAMELSKDIPGLEVEPLQISQLPLLNTDLEVDGGFPDAVEEFRASVLKADAILFACPEYNYSVSGVLKNAIDWASRAPNAWADKPAAIMSAGGGMGGGRSQYHLRQIGIYVDLHFLNKPELFVRAFEPPTKFDHLGDLVHPDTRDRVKQLLVSLQQWTIRLQKK